MWKEKEKDIHISTHSRVAYVWKYIFLVHRMSGVGACSAPVDFDD